MNENSFNPTPEQLKGELFVSIAPEEMSNYPEYFGGGSVSSIQNPIPPTEKAQQVNLQSDKSKVIQHNFVKELSHRNILLRYNDNLFMADGVIYRPYNDEFFTNLVFNYIYNCGYESDYKTVRSIIDELKMRANNFFGEPNDERYTYCKNGFFNNQTGVMEQCISGYFPTIQLNGQYLGQEPQYHSLMDNFMSTLFADNPIFIQRAWEIIGYCISSDAHAKRFFIFPGASGDNGKSTFIDLIYRLFQGPAISGLSMKNLLGSRFAMSELQGKRINISSDEGALNFDTSQMAILKRLSGHDIVTCDKKNTNQVNFLSTCKIIIASNHNIGMAYTNNDTAVMRRICTLPFNVRIPKEQQNPDIVKIILSSELNQIITEALNAYFKLKCNGYCFTGDGTSLDEYSIRTVPADEQYDAIQNFVEKCISPIAENFVFTQDLYEAFFKFNNYQEYPFKDITGFSQALYNYLTSNGILVEKVKKHAGNGYKGIQII